ncbi:MAG: flagellar protein FlaG [Gammaproteobacteria bacterium]|nr:flagellar protein FlaG [Gammaproteobacteria bacterium]
MPTPIVTQVTATRSAGFGSAGHGQPEQQASSRQQLPEQADDLPADASVELAATQAAETELIQAVSRLNDYVQNLRRDLRFSIDEGTGHTVITVTDSATQEVIRQIPSEEALAIAHSLETNQGVILRAKA